MTVNSKFHKTQLLYYLFGMFCLFFEFMGVIKLSAKSSASLNEVFVLEGASSSTFSSVNKEDIFPDEINAPASNWNTASNGSQVLNNMSRVFSIDCEEKENKLIFSEQKLFFEEVGEKIFLQFNSNQKNIRYVPQIFFRESKYIGLTADRQFLVSQEFGQTEMYFYYKGQMYVLPVVVGGDKHSITNNSLTSVLRLSGLSKKQNTWVENTLSSSEDIHRGNYKKEEDDYYYKEFVQSKYKKLSFQVVDDRSDLLNNIIYPVANVNFSIVGLGVESLSDERGRVSDIMLPHMGRVLVKIKDRAYNYKNTYAEISVSSWKDGDLVPIVLKRKFAYNNILQSIGVLQEEGKASVCIKIDSTKEDLKDVSVLHDSLWNEKVYYLNEQGFIDGTLNTMGENGYFCAFNLSSGPIAFELHKNETSIGTLPVNLFTSSHQEVRVNVDEKLSVRTRPVIMRTSKELLREYGHTYRFVGDDIKLHSFGGQEVFDSGTGLHTFSGLISPSDWLHYYSSSPEFEPTVFNFSPTQEVFKNTMSTHISPLFPRGFVEAMADEAGIYVDRDLGVVVVDHKLLYGQDETQAVVIKHLDENELEVGDSFIYQDGSEMKTIVFNVPPGLYTILVESQDSEVLDIQMVQVYSQYLSYSNTGSKQRFQRYVTN